MRMINHTWYYKITEKGKEVVKKVVMTRPSPNGKPIMMASLNAQEINELKQKERNMNLEIVTKKEYMKYVKSIGGKA